MRKILALLFCGVVSMSVMANDTEAKSRWYLQGLVGLNNSGTETMGIGEFSNNLGFMGDLEFGYEFNPYIGLGMQLQYARTHSIWDNNENFGINALMPSLNLEWNITNTLLGYKADRKNAFRLYGGIAGASTSTLFSGYEYGDKTDNNYALGFRAGLQYERAMKNDWAFVVDAGINSFNDKFEHRSNGGLDSHIGLQVGFRKYFGNTARRKDYKETIVNYIERRDTVTIKKIEEITAPKDMYSIFFERDKIIIRDSETPKIKAVADFMKAHPEKVVFVFGYADKNTGTKKRNAWLAENRARVICEQLTGTYGIDPSRIISYHQGDNVQPFTEEEFEKNRATICVITDFVR